MRRSIVSLFSFLAIALIALTGCQEPQNSIPGSVDSISVRVMDSTDAKTITPEGNVNISHYVITVVNEAEGINQSSGYLTKGSMFTVSNVPAGTWYAKVDAYIQRGEEGSYTYVKVASDQSEPKTVQAGASTTFELVLDTLDAVASGNVTVTLKMPTALSAESTAFWYQYTITGMTDEEFSHTSELLSGTTGADGLATITIDADAIGLMQGAYRFAITVQDAKTSPTLTRKGVDVMRLVNGLEAKGTIDLTTYEADQSFDVTITDKIGDILTPALEDGKEVYNLGGQDGSASLTVTLAEPLKANETIEWYVDGELDETVNADEASSGKYFLTFTPGSHIVTAIVRDTDTLMAVGSIDEFKVMIVAEFAEKVFTFEFDAYSQSYTVTGLVKEVGEFEMPSSGVLEIPSSYQGKPVTQIGSGAFEGRTDIVGSVVIPDSVKTIKFNAFLGCSALTGINIPDSVTEIGSDAFSGCYALQSIIIPKCMTTIGNGVFRGCSTLTGINISDSVTEIESNAFLGCSSLASITIPDGVTSIGSSAFESCSALETVEISDTSQLTSIGTDTFKNCSSLTSINIPDGVTEIGRQAFYGCSALKAIEIADTSQLASIGTSAFENCSSLTSISIPEGITTIQGNTFKGCFTLAEVNLPSTLTAIKGDSFSGGAFENCSSLTSINIPGSVLSIGGYAFRGCSSLASITIPDGVTSIGSSAFESCSVLETVEISDTSQLTSIGTDAFKNCSSLTSINIPDGVTEIGRQAFYGCSSLQSITIPEGVTTIEVGTFYRCAGLTEVILPSTLTAIKGDPSYSGAFSHCSSLTSINILDGVTEIGRQAFYDCSSLQSITIPESVTSIGSNAFENCSTLTSITIPEGVTSIGHWAFKDCSSLTDIYCEASAQPEGWNSYWLSNCAAEVHWGYTNE